ncbi:MAG: hypothetical protein AB7L94_16930 [Kofleriaceae bacterium]
MHRLVVVAAALLGACGVDTDDRPATLEYITAAILAPNCGNAQCHSSFRRVDDYAFDTIEETRITLTTYQGLVVPSEPNESVLYQVLVSPGGENQAPRMPYDQPIPNRDVELIYHWIDEGAEGIVIP